jgi:tRNA threonylcarbamoyladenosine biosynthesis protein TsaB
VLKLTTKLHLLPYILSIESSGIICSVALHKNEQFLDCIESTETNVHGEKLAVFIDEILKKNALTPSDLSAIAASEGPGSYTGLRIGVSVAKGMCYALSIPLISIDTLKSLAHAMLMAQDKLDVDTVFLPMIDARRMEVYLAGFDTNLNKIITTKPVILEEEFYSGLEKTKTYYIAGSGASKVNYEVEGLKMIKKEEIGLTAKYIGALALAKFRENDFEDVAYFEPVYLKEFAMILPGKG